MNYTLENDKLNVRFSSIGGTMTSVQDKTGLEYLWQGDKAYWSGQAPILFPICGSLRNDEAAIGKGRRTHMPRHGIVRKREFQFEVQTKDSITFSIASDAASLEAFPYPFKLYARYELLGNSIRVTYTVENTGSEVMPFFVGGHPGFNCPLVPGEDYADYRIEFEQPETCDVPTPVTETGLIDVAHRQPFLNGAATLALRHELFETDAVILDALRSRKLRLFSSVSGKGVELDYAEFPYLILWASANHGNFVAIEPWTGLSTCSDEGNVFEEKRNVQTVEAGKEKAFSFIISVF